MLSKLAFRNAKRSFKDYVVYLVTVIFSFAIIFSFNLVAFSEEIASLSETMNLLGLYVIAVSVVVVFVIAWLINYTTKFMFEKRSKEFGTYMLLGIEKKKISRLFVVENAFLGCFSFVVSLLIGFLLAQVISYIITGLFDLSYSIMIDVSWKALILSIVYFILIYAFALLRSKARIKKLKIYDLLYFEKKNESTDIKTKKWQVLLFILSIIVGIAALILFDRQFSGNGEDADATLLMISILLIVLSVYGVTITLSGFILRFIIKSKKIKYKNDNLFVYRQFASKVNTMRFTLGTLALLSTLSLMSLYTGSMFKGVMDNQTQMIAPFDIGIYNIDDENIDDYTRVIEENYTIKEKNTCSVYTRANDVDEDTFAYKVMGWTEIDDPFISLTDYNEIMDMMGRKELTLDEDEFFVYIAKEWETRGFKEYFDNNPNLSIGETNLKIKDICFKGFCSGWIDQSGILIVVPDAVLNSPDLTLEQTLLNVNTVEETKTDFAEILRKEVPSSTNMSYFDSATYYYDNFEIKAQRVAESNSGTIILSFSLMYLSFIFIATTGTIIAIQSLSDSAKYKFRYTILNKLGLSKRHINKIIFKQLIINFFSPLIYPLIINISVVYSLNKLFAGFLSSGGDIWVRFLQSLACFLIIYIVYFCATFFGFKKNLKEQ